MHSIVFTLSVALSFTGFIAADKVLLPRTTGIPSSILSELLTAIPSASLSDLAIPASYAIISSQIAAGETPNWYAGLPSDVKAYFSAEAANTGTAVRTLDTATAVTAYRTSVGASQNTQSSTTSPSSSTNTAATSTGTAAAATSSSAALSKSSALSIGAIVGLAIAAIIFIALATGLAIWVILKRNRRSKISAPAAGQTVAMDNYKNTAYQGATYPQYQNGPYQSVPNPTAPPYVANDPTQLYDPVKSTPPGVAEMGANEVYEVDGGSTHKK